jgi:2-polyprenyl-3-methyl-5-hydroxy-6-metoxy-1,4-benzoquinol methylase
MTRLEKILKSIHNLLYRFGLDIRLAKKEEQIDAIAYNSIESANKYWASQKNKQVWDSAEYKEFYSLLIRVLKEHHVQLDEKEWCDVGCGSGTLLVYLKQEFKSKSINGFEVAQSAIDISKKRIPEGTFKVYSLYEPAEEKFDIVFCTEVLEHLLYPDKAFKNLTQRLHPESYLIVTVPNGRLDTWGGHINYWSPESWKIFIEQNLSNRKFVSGKIEDRALYAIIFPINN